MFIFRSIYLLLIYSFLNYETIQEGGNIEGEGREDKDGNSSDDDDYKSASSSLRSINEPQEDLLLLYKRNHQNGGEELSLIYMFIFLTTFLTHVSL